jgi:hypothetical protein
MNWMIKVAVEQGEISVTASRTWTVCVTFLERFDDGFLLIV